MRSDRIRRDLLLVDDDESLRETLAMILRTEGFDVRTAGDGAAALATLRDGPRLPDLMLMDLVMPHVTGWELLETIRADAGLRGIAVVVLSGDGHASRKASLMGIADVLQKPFDLAAVLRVVERLCSPS